jgi:DNA-binding MarR family transcriptional regulator
MIHLSKIVHVNKSILPGPVVAVSPATTEADPTERIITDFRAAMTQIKCAMGERLLRLGISMAQLNILYTLRRSSEMTMSHLADVLNVSLSNATGLIDRLEERGYIERTRVPEDRRIVMVHLTASGVGMIDEQDAVADDLLRTVLGRLNPTQILTIAQATADLRAALEGTTAPAPNRHPVSTPTPRSPSTMHESEGRSGATQPRHHVTTTSRRD